MWVLAVAGLVLAVGWAATMRTVAVDARHRAETAADLAALAAAGRIGLDDRGCAWGARIAEADGGNLTRCRVQLAPDGRSGTVLVAVRVRTAVPFAGGSVTASARAGRASGVAP